MNVLFVWTGVTSYMADCWRELARRDDVRLKVIIERHSSGAEIEASKVLEGFDAQIVDLGSRVNLGDLRPDVIFAVGWHSETVQRIVRAREYANIPKVCCFDMPWRWQLRCIAAKFVLAHFLRHYDAAFVPGERAERYAKWLGFGQIHRGLFSLDTSRFLERAEGRGFLYVGRHAPEKRLDIIEQAYARYGQLGGKWDLDVYGGPRFVQPAGMPEIYANHACLLLASSFDPWPLVMLEATASGLMVIASDRCGNVDDLGAKSVPYGDVEAMAQAMLDAEKGLVCPAGKGRAMKYDSKAWSGRVVDICRQLVK